MKKRQILLSEAEFFNLIRRIVKEAQEDEMDMDMDMEGSEEMSPVEMIAQWFEDEGILDLPERKIDRIEDKLEMIKSRSLRERRLYEDDDMGKKRSSFASRMMQVGGGVMTVAGLMGVVGNSMGWTESEISLKLRELTSMLGDTYEVGPLSVAMLAAGIGLALAGKAKAYNEKRK